MQGSGVEKIRKSSSVKRGVKIFSCQVPDGLKKGYDENGGIDSVHTVLQHLSSILSTVSGEAVSAGGCSMERSYLF
jgi:hypothetical protein